MSFLNFISGDAEYLTKLLIGGAAGGGVIYVFMRGSIVQMGQWKSLVESHQDRSDHLELENNQMNTILGELRTTIDECRLELYNCEKHRFAQAEELEGLKIEVTSLKNMIALIRKPNRGET